MGVPVSLRLACLAVLVLALGAAACGSDSQAQGGGPPPVVVQVLQVEGVPLPRTLQTVGTLAAPERSTIAAEIDEQVVEVSIPEGTRVEAGALLARLDDSRARSALEGARARFKNADARKQRLESLRASSVSSDQAYEDAIEAFEMARSELEQAQTQLEKTQIRAPFSGVVGLAQITGGQYVTSGTPIVSITRVNPLDLVFSVPQERARELAVGQRVFGAVGVCGQRFEGSVIAIEPRVDPATRTLDVKARVPNEAGTLWTGMAASVRVVVDEIPDAVRVPQEAIVREGGRYLVYVVDDEDKAHQQAVELGTYFVDGVHVRTGLEPGARVVVTGHQKLRPGAPTRPEPYQLIDNPNLELGWLGPADDCRAAGG